MSTNNAELVSELVYAILQDNNLSRSQLTTLLGYTSKTSIDRIAQEISGERALLDFYDRISAHPELMLKAHSKQAFFRVSSIYGKDSSHEWLQLLKESEDSPVSNIYVHNLENGEKTEFVSTYRNRQNLKIYIHGCISPIFIANIRMLVNSTTCHCCQYLRLADTAAHMSKAIRSMIPVIFSPHYEGYVYEEPQDMDTMDLILPYNCMLVTYTDESGNHAAECLTFETATSCLVFPVQMSHALESLVLKKLHSNKLNPVVNNILSLLKNDYAKYIFYCEGLEKDHNVYQFKPDFGFEQIEASLIFKAIREGIFLTVPGMDKIFTEFIPIQIRRYENNCSMRTEQIHVLKESALRAFAETGMMSDHFWGMRAFTPKERVEILSLLISRAENEANYKIYLLDEGKGFTDTEVTLYEGAGLSIIKPHTSYSLADGHSETIIESPVFCSSYKHFFLHELIPQYTRDQRASLKILKNIVVFIMRKYASQMGDLTPTHNRY